MLKDLLNSPFNIKHLLSAYCGLGKLGELTQHQPDSPYKGPFNSTPSTAIAAIGQIGI